VVHIGAELAPYARTGGLGEAIASLASFQARAGLQVAIIAPLYREVADKQPPLRPVGDAFNVYIADRVEEARLFEVIPEGAGPHPRILFVANQYYFDRAGIYGDRGGDFGDNARRYAFFCLAALQALPRISAVPPVVHAHDWHAALAPVYLRSWLRRHPYYSQSSSVLSVHNAGFQGHFPRDTMADLGLPWELYNSRQLEWYDRVNLLKGGMAFADAVATVSATHANELRTPDGGFGLHEAFSSLGGRFVGITNGIDQREWDPTHDPDIAATYSANALAGKTECKTALQRLFGLPVRPQVPVFAMAARMVYQKGLDLILGSGFLELDAQYVFLGSGEPRYERALRDLALRFPDRVGVQLTFTDRLEHRVLSGADLCLMPSMYEPCGLTQMRAQRYGTLPLARRVGGLADTVADGVTGFLFDDYSSRDFLEGTTRAIVAFRNPPQWTQMQRMAMGRDFGWEAAERKYEQVYRFAQQRVEN
jgi:starch synthase